MGLFSNLFGDSTEPPPLRCDAKPSQAQRVYEEGVRLLENGQQQEALLAFLKATEIDSNCVDACVALARCFHAMNPEKYCEEALQFGERAFKADPTNSRARNIASVVNFEKGKIAWHSEECDEAVDSFKRSFEIEPNDKQTLSALGYCAQRADRLGDFADICEARLDESPDDHPIKYTLGKTLLKMAISAPTAPDQKWMQSELLRRAEKHLTDYLSIDSINPDANYRLGVIFIMMGRLEEASHVVARLADIDPEKSKDLEELLTG